MFNDADLVLACPYCDTPSRLFQISSAFTFEAITWTDGWMDAPMMPRAPRISRCRHCQKIFWVFTAQQLGIIPLAATGEAAGDFADIPHLGPLNEADCQEALREGLGANSELELELRVFAWWRGNDAFREPFHPTGHSTSAFAVENMERFILLAENGDEDLLLYRAEALRHLGRFEDARHSLDPVGCSDYWPAKSRQIELIEAGSRDLAVLFSPERPPQYPEA